MMLEVIKDSTDHEGLRVMYVRVHAEHMSLDDKINIMRKYNADWWGYTIHKGYFDVVLKIN